MNGLDQFKRAAAKVKLRREAEALVTKVNVNSSVPLSVPITIKNVQLTDAEQAEADEQFRIELQATIIRHFKKLKGAANK